MINFPHVAFIFPGQGSQSIGMMTELYANHQIVRDTYQEANDALNEDIWQLSAEGPSEKLNQTIYTQPAMLVAGVAAYRAFAESFSSPIAPAYFAGHSLGEYTALVASNQLEFIEALKLARKRAQAMQDAVPAGIGAMAAILGLSRTIIEDICQSISNSSHKVWFANDNSLGQSVIAGHHIAVDTACEKLKLAGAKRALILPVSVPSHCPLMQPAADIMQSEFSQAVWGVASAPVIHNIDVQMHEKQIDKVYALTEQLIRPVRWVETIQFFAASSITTVIEFGPGKVLCGLNKRIEKDMEALSVADDKSLVDVLNILNSH